MSAPTFDIVPSRELLLCLLKLSGVKEFQDFINFLDNRCTNMAIVAHNVPGEPYRTWASGRVQELAGLLALYHQRNRLFAMLPNPNSPAVEADE